jgi:hypothetical protein
MKTSKIIFAVFACLFFVGRTFAQQIDYDSVKELDKRLVEFTAVLEKQVNRMEGSNLKNTTRAAAKVLKYETNKVLRKIETMYPADDNYVLNALFDNALAQDIQSFAPATASFLRTRATVTLIEGAEREITVRPEYYRVLIQIKKICRSIDYSVGLKKVNLYTDMLKVEHRKLKEMIK